MIMLHSFALVKSVIIVFTRVETSTRTWVGVRRVPGISGLPGYLVFTLIGLPVITMDVSYAAK